jgi:hypothetical protein
MACAASGGIIPPLTLVEVPFALIIVRRPSLVNTFVMRLSRQDLLACPDGRGQPAKSVAT